MTDTQNEIAGFRLRVEQLRANVTNARIALDGLPQDLQRLYHQYEQINGMRVQAAKELLAEIGQVAGTNGSLVGRETMTIGDVGRISPTFSSLLRRAELDTTRTQAAARDFHNSVGNALAQPSALIDQCAVGGGELSSELARFARESGPIGGLQRVQEPLNELLAQVASMNQRIDPYLNVPAPDQIVSPTAATTMDRLGRMANTPLAQAGEANRDNSTWEGRSGRGQNEQGGGNTGDPGGVDDPGGDPGGVDDPGGNPGEGGVIPPQESLPPENERGGAGE